MEVLLSDDYFILVDGEHTLWCSRIDGKLTPKSRQACNQEMLKQAACIGVIYGIVGKFQAYSDSSKRLVVIHQKALVGCLHGNSNVYKIQKVALLPLNKQDSPDIDIEPCKKHHANVLTPERQSITPDIPTLGFQRTWNTIKTATAQVKPRIRETKDKLEKRILTELLKIFNETDSFYYSVTWDLSNSLQRQNFQNTTPCLEGIPLWRRVDDRFFWNKNMLNDLIDLWDVQADHWILPVIQGYVQIQKCTMSMFDEENSIPSVVSGPLNTSSALELRKQQNKEYNIILISRRSRYRAGTRYKRRGVDETGHCANYVETEQIFEFQSHIVSFVQVRGSVPVYWSQPGNKYRPPPRLEKGEEETRVAFQKHFAQELSIYKSEVIINLVQQVGKEKVLADAYLNHILEYNSPDLVYVTFDFHEYCREMKLENVSILIGSIADIIKDMRYCWIENGDVICEQCGVFRINCIDCLDRTNVVQTAIAKTVMDTQFIRLGLLPPEGVLPAGCRRVFQMMWANNGDVLSRQYAGTVALKGDFTRTGERCFTGVMKDGYNSASRYYMNQFKDAYRQATFDLMLGNQMEENIMTLTKEQEHPVAASEFSEQDHYEHVKQLIEDCKKILIPETEIILGGWALIDADSVSGDPSEQDMDIVLVLTKDSYFVAEYDNQLDRIMKYQQVLLEDLENIEFGPEPSIFKSRHYCIRFCYSVSGQSGYFHMFRMPKTCFFNNMAVPIRSDEDAIESLRAICEAFRVALSMKGLNVPFFEGKLERKKSKLPFCQASGKGHPQNEVDEGQLMNFLNVGSRVLSSMTSQLAKLNPIKTVRGFGKHTENIGQPSLSAEAPTLQKQHPLIQVDNSEDDSEDDHVIHSKKQSISGPISEYFLSLEFSESSDRHEKRTQDTLLKSCGILATGPSLCYQESVEFVDVEQKWSKHCHRLDMDDFVLDAMRKASVSHLQQRSLQDTLKNSSSLTLDAPDLMAATNSPASLSPQIQINTDSGAGFIMQMDNLPVLLTKPDHGRKLSRSSEEIDIKKVIVSSTSDKVTHLLIQPEVILNPDSLSGKIKTSHSESAIQDFPLLPLTLPNPLVSPIVIKKDDVLSPLLKVAKGVQSFGMNLRPGSRSHSQQASMDLEEFEKLQEQKRKCQSRIIEL